MPSTLPRQHIVVLGAALSANKGAASMLLALLDHIDEVLPGGSVVSLSTYPVRDAQAKESERLQIVSYRPLAMLLVNFPLAILIGFGRLLGFRGRVLAVTPALRAMMDSVVVADLAGISFSDGRGLPTLVYNTLMTGIPLVVGAPVVKCSQAIGPLDQVSTRAAGRLVLPRLRAIVARGERTHQHLIDFGLDNVVEGADLAFIMEVSEGHRAKADELIGNLGGQRYFVVSASSVVEALCSAKGIDYVALVAKVVERLTTTTGHAAVLIAHSARPGQEEGRMNDLPVTRRIAERCSDGTTLIALDEDLDPRVLRAIIGGGRFLLASRFHAMVSGLSTGTPTVVVGWSHKYREVMKEFALERFVLSFSGFTAEAVVDLALEANADHESIAARIREDLPRVKESSRNSFAVLRETIDV
jgi:colanic acid/amylovoran biosynthesis protein